MSRYLGLLFTILFLHNLGRISAQVVPADFSDQLVLGGWTDAVGATWDTNGRMYVWEKRGIVWIVENGVKLPDPLLDISEEVGNWRDHGMLGFTLDPQFLTNGRIYLFYTVDRHHLMNFGTGSYNPATNQYYAATIMRITRYTATGPQFNSVDPASRMILFGETPSTGAPVLHESHTTGSLVFGADGTLLASVGDGASYSSTDVGNANETYWSQAILDGIIRPEENVGALRAQMVNSFNGRILRLDPNTGNGVPSNPWFDPAEPRSGRSRTWALGLRNPYRMTIRPGTGSSDPAAAQPGHLHIGDVGWNLWEELNVCTEGGMNFGWPLFEGFDVHASYWNTNAANKDHSNPLYDGISCSQQFFNFQDLIKQATPVHLNAHPNPCDPLVQIPNSVPKHFHARPAIDWRHGNQSRCGGFSGNTAITHDLDNAGSPVPGPRFGGYAAIGGPFIAGTNFPPAYQNSSYHGDYVMGWIRRFVIDGQGNPVSVHDFASGLGNITWMGAGPDGCIWYIRYNSNQIRKICYTQNVVLPPVAVATQDVQYGTGPLTVHFTGNGSYHPQNAPITYHWDFGDGQTSTAMDPVHMFQATPGVPITFTVTLTVTAEDLQTSTTQLLVSVNNTPPQVQITSFANGSFYPVGVDTVFQLQANVLDLEHGPAQLDYAWQTILHHNTHSHPEPVDGAPQSSTVISGVGCDGESYSYRIRLTVTDPEGLATTVEHWLYPACHTIAPTAIINSDVTAGALPLAVQFDGSGSYDPGSVVAYHWNFGDGTSSTEPSPLKVFTESGDHLVVLTVTDDDGLTGQSTRSISSIAYAPPQCPGQSGSIMREVWNGITGTTVNDLLSSPGFPDTPNAITYPTSFQGPSNVGDNYGARYRGYIVAPQTGAYTFTITSDDASVVYLSLNADPRFKRVICSVPGWTQTTEYTKYPSQISAAIQLQAGVYYYVEVLHKEGGGNDHLALRWQTPSNSTRTIIPNSALARWQDCPPSVRLRMGLQGPYHTGTQLMRDDLRSLSLLPLTEPYTLLGFTQAGGGGETIPPARLNVTGKNAMVDWVLVELRSKNDPSQILATKAAILERDGDVVGTDGYMRLLFNVPADDYFIAVRHRNHLGIRTATAVSLSKDESLIDLTRPTTPVHGAEARKAMPDAVMTLWAGDALRDGVIRYTGANNDRDIILQAIGGLVPTVVTPGYGQGDLDLDGFTRYTGMNNDRDIILQNIGGIIPTAVRHQQLP